MSQNEKIVDELATAIAALNRIKDLVDDKSSTESLERALTALYFLKFDYAKKKEKK